MIPTTPSEIEARFGDAGAIAGRMLAAPEKLPEIGLEARQRLSRSGRQLIHAGISCFFSFYAWTFFDVAGPLLAAVTSTVLINRAFTFFDAMHRARLLEPCDHAGEMSSAPPLLPITASAREWLDLVRESGRPLHRFDVEIISMLEEHDDLLMDRP